MFIPIDRLTTHHTEAVQAFLRRIYGAEFYGADPVYFDWLYRQCPCDWFADNHQRGELPINAVLDKHGEIEAIHAFQPFDARTPFGGTVGIWDVEWINGSGRRGVGRALAQYLVDSVDVYAGYGCNDLSAAAFQKMGLALLPATERAVFVLNSGRLQALLAANGLGELAGLVGPQAAAPAEVLTTPWREWESTAALDPTVLEQATAVQPLGVTRSPAWLAWRYDHHPFIRYHVVGPERGRGAAIVRLETVAGTAEIVCRIVDLFPETGQMAPLLAAVLAFAAGRKALLADFITPSSPVVAALKVAVAPCPLLRNPRIPYMFQPLQTSAHTCVNLVFGLGRGRSASLDATLEMARQFYATKADSNQDILRSLSSAPRLVRAGTGANP